MVRVAALKNGRRRGRHGARRRRPDARPAAAARSPSARTRWSTQLYATLSGEILPALAERGLRLVRPGDLEPAARGRARRATSASEVLPALTPLAIDASRPFPMLASLSLNLAVLLAPADGEDEPRLAVVQVPGAPAAPRAAARRRGHGARAARGRDPGGAARASSPARRSATSAAFRVTRDSELELDDEGGRDYLQAIEEELRNRRRQRRRAPGGRGRRQRSRCSRCSSRRLEVTAEDVYRVRGPLDLRPLLPLVDLPALEDLRDPPLKPQPVLEAAGPELFALLDERDVLLHHPYESFDPVVAVRRQRRPTIPTCSRSSRRSTARAATRRSCARWRGRPRTASR